MIYTTTYPIITSDYSAIWQHELLYDLRHAVLTNSNWMLRMLLWLSGLGYNLLVPCGFLPWGRKKKNSLPRGLPHYSPIRNSPRMEEFNLTAAATSISTIVFPWLLKNTIILKFPCLLDLTGALVNRFSLLRMILRKRIQHSNWCECLLLAFTFFNVTCAFYCALACIFQIRDELLYL